MGGLRFALALLLACASGSMSHAANGQDAAAIVSNDAATEEIITTAEPAEDADTLELDTAKALKATTLYAFRGLANGRFARGGLASDEDGNIYGTLYYDGACDPCGLVYMLRKPTKGQTKWTFSILVKFSNVPGNGFAPTGKLLFHDGAIYGTTTVGANSACGCGSVFKLRPLNAGKTQWAFTYIYRFQNTQDGAQPVGGVIFGKDGAVYGTTSRGGKNGGGTVFRLTGSGNSDWKKTTLHSFEAGFSGPQGELAFGKDGALYGNTYGGGKYRVGVVFQMTGKGNNWKYKVLYNFRGIYQGFGSTDGADPEGHLTFGQDGLLYGTTTVGGGVKDSGTIFSLKKPKAGKTQWTYKVIHRFQGGPSDGTYAHSGLTLSSTGALYGTTAGGGPNGGGTVYRLTPKANGSYDFSLVHTFVPRSKNGDDPNAGVIIRGKTLYGPTLTGGLINPGALKDGKADEPGCRDGCGVVYQLTP